MSYNIKLSRYPHRCFSVQRYHANKCICNIVSRPRKKNTHPIDRELLAYEPLNDLIMILLTNLILFFKRISFADMILLTAVLLFLIVILLKAITFLKLFILRTFSLLLTTLSSSSTCSLVLRPQPSSAVRISLLCFSWSLSSSQCCGRGA